MRFLEQGLQEGDRVASSQQSVEEQLAKEDESLTAATMGGVAAELSRHQSAFGCDGVEGGEREIEVQVQCFLVEREIESTGGVEPGALVDVDLQVVDINAY